MNVPATQTLLGFEQARVDAELAAQAAKLHAKLAARTQRAILKRQAETDKATRRLMRAHEQKQKQPDQVAVCGFYFYTLSPRERERGCFWTHCRGCGKPLRYFNSHAEAEAQNGECKRA